MSPARLSPEDQRILKLEAGPIAGHTCKVVTFDSAPGGHRETLDQLRASVESRLRLAPRLRQRLLATPLRLAAPVWVDDPSFDLARHIRPLGNDDELDDRGLRRAVGRLMTERLDRERPLWTLDVAPLTAGRTALVWCLHHCMADGSTAMRLGAALLWGPEPTVAPSAPARWEPASPPGALALVAEAARERVGRAARGISSGARSLGSPERWRAAAAELRGVPGTIRRELAPRALPSALARPAGSRREVAWTSAPLAALHAAGKVGEDITINDVVLAVTAGGFHDWLAAHGSRGRAVRAKVPVSLHTRAAEDTALANRDSFLFVDLPVAEPSAGRRLWAINRETAERKRDHDAERIDRLVYALAHLPAGGRVIRLLMSPRLFTFTVSNIPGPREPQFVLGGPLRSIHSLAEIAPGHALRVSLLSACGSLSFGLCADAETVPDLDVFIAGIDRSIDQLLTETARSR